MISVEPVRYTIAICKGSALIDETAALLRVWRPDQTLDELTDEALRNDVLGKATEYRVRDIVRRVFAPRFLRPDNRAARDLSKLLCAGRDGIRQPAFLYSCRADALLRDATKFIYWPAAKRGQLTLSPSDLLPFFHEAERDQRIPTPWSPSVSMKVARGLIGAWMGFGLLEPSGRTEHRIPSFAVDDRMFVYLSYLLHYQGLSDHQVVEDDEWSLFGLAPDDVSRQMLRLSDGKWWEAQMGGNVIRITWHQQSMDEVTVALTR